MINQDTFRGYVVNEMLSIINNYLGNYKLSYGIADADIWEFSEDILNENLMADIQSLVDSDPAVQVVDDTHSYVFKNYKGMRAILYYRIANKLIYDNKLVEEYDDYIDILEEDDNEISTSDIFFGLARKISEDAAIATTIEINPKAKIGKGFVIDHGINVKIAADDEEFDSGIVIGETCEIGENCCLLNGVVLGAIDVNDGSKSKRRHPILKNNVTICSNVKVLGKITIGNNVFISPNCIITTDIPDNCNVKMINELQITKHKQNIKSNGIIIYGLVPMDNGLQLHGENLLNANLSVVDEKHKEVDCINLKLIHKDDNVISFELKNDNSKSDIPKSIFLSIWDENTLIYMYNSRALNHIISKFNIK